jgi:hypothetical protein
MSNFFELYAKYADKTEPPPNFHAWSAIGAISALLGKKCQIPQGHFTVFPHLYIVLVGDPGTRKSTAMNIAKRLVRLVPSIPIAAESSSREALIDFMAESKVPYNQNGKDFAYWQASSFGTELEQFLGGKHINQAMVGFLTAIWDEPIFVEQTRKSGRITIHNPYFTMLGCCTPGWVTDKLKNDVITDGFSRRVIFALEKEPACLNPWPQNTPDKLETLALLSNETQRIFQISGQFTLTKQALKLYSTEYVKMREEAKKFSEKIQAYFTSKHELVLKIAMCISAGLDSYKIIDSKVIEMACQYLSQSERCLETVFAGVGRNELKAHADRALDKMRLRNTGTTKAQFIQENYSDLNKVELDEVWEMLSTTGLAIPGAVSSAQDVPTLRAAVKDPLPPALNLLDLVRHLKRLPEEKMGETGAFEVARHLAPETERLLSSLEERRRLSDAGILLKGRRAQDAGELEGPSA